LRSLRCTLAVLVGALLAPVGFSVGVRASAVAAQPLQSRALDPETPTTARPIKSAGPVKIVRPWKARRSPFPPPSSHQLVETSRWPQEPAAPDVVGEAGAAKFRTALAYLCRRPEAKVPADELRAAAREAGVDVFLLAALVHERSRCDARKRTRGGMGLLALDRKLYEGRGAPGPTIHSSEWRPASLLSARANLSLGARLLRMWEEQHDAIDLAFGGVPHRSGVSHFFWGDVVTSSGNEDLVLTARRRLIARFLDSLQPEPRMCELGVPVVPPLETAPRVATSGPGDDRDGGARRHRGLDVVAAVGEPIRAIADGTVIFAGVNLPGNARRPVPPSKVARFANQSLGAGGIYLCIRHSPADPARSGTVSCYMHLSRYFVAQGAAVKAGDTIGIVGRSGVKRSPPHLHFEVRVDGQFKDPWRYFSDTIIPPRETLTHQFNQRIRKARLRAAARAARTTAVNSGSPKS
jgi:murein DD-endopeptidase MepM/ murein hydrolase activator NlpD